MVLQGIKCWGHKINQIEEGPSITWDQRPTASSYMPISDIVRFEIISL